MALSASTLANLIESKLPPLERSDAQAERKKVLTAIAQGVVEHIVAQAVVTVTVPALGLVSAAPGSPVTGAAAGTGGVT